MLPKSKIANAAGSRNNYVTIERATTAAVNGSMERVTEYETCFSRWASSVPQGGTEFNIAMQTQPYLRAILKLPYDPETATITTRDRVDHDGRIQEIVSAFNEGNNNETIVLWVIDSE